MEPFRNEPLLDFSESDAQKGMQAALTALRKRFCEDYPLVIAGKDVKLSQVIESRNPNAHEEVVARFSRAGRAEAEKALLAAVKAFESWKCVPSEQRAELLFRVAGRLRARRFEIDAAMVLEAGKSWPEADGDFAEAVDMCEYYGRQLLSLEKRADVLQLPGERDEMRYIPLGAGLVIPPWNFPCAILTGMTTAAVVSGNTVVLKPSSDTPLVGYLVFRCLEEAGLPPGVVNFVPGSGAEVGDFLVQHPLTRFVSFTGSKEVGLRINELAAKPSPGQRWIKRVSAEMGGKDAIIVAGDADLEQAAKGIIAAAFGYQGQKCSACSRAIIDAKVYDRMLLLLREGVEKLRVGPVENPENFMGGVINARAYDSIMQYLEAGKKEGRLLCGGVGDKSVGNVIQPTIIVDVPPRGRIAQEEIFGPVLTVIRAKDFGDALAIANDSEYGLTGAVFSKDPKKLERAKDEFHVGNLYLNRKCTGAMVGAHPFGGFNMSGTCSKAGGPDYLLLFLQAKSIGEKL